MGDEIDRVRRRKRRSVGGEVDILEMPVGVLVVIGVADVLTGESSVRSRKYGRTAAYALAKPRCGMSCPNELQLEQGEDHEQRGDSGAPTLGEAGTAIKIVRAVMTTFSQRVVVVCRSVAFCWFSMATRRQSMASPRGVLSGIAVHPAARIQRQARCSLLPGLLSKRTRPPR